MNIRMVLLMCCMTGAAHAAGGDDPVIAEVMAVEWMFRPASAVHWFAAERPFELRFATDDATLEMVTWGTATAGRRLAD